MSNPSTSLILALHARWEQSIEDTNKVDRNHGTLKQEGEELLLRFRYEDALSVMLTEREHLVRAILYQVPTTDEELTVVAHHLFSLYEPDGDDLPAADRKAIEIALVNLFDYLVSEGRAEMEKIGPSFGRTAMLAWHRRRTTQGLLDGEA